MNFASIFKGSAKTWLHHSDIVHSKWHVKYINSLYFSFVTMTTVGYGDISPQNPVEKLFVILMMIVACGVFAYSINSIGVTIQEMYQQEDNFRFLLLYFIILFFVYL